MTGLAASRAMGSSIAERPSARAIALCRLPDALGWEFSWRGRNVAARMHSTSVSRYASSEPRTAVWGT